MCVVHDCVIGSPPSQKELLLGTFSGYVTTVFPQIQGIKLETVMSVIFEGDVCHISAQKIVKL
jgi:hypothetical protein